MATPAQSEPPIRRAARFIQNLDAQAAEAMLARLTPGEASSLRAAIAQLDAAAQPADRSDAGGVELHLSTAAAAAPPPAPATTSPATTIPVAANPPDGAEWLRSLRDADPRAIAEFLSREQPRAIAVVLGYLEPGLSAAVLAELPTAERGRVVAQLASAGEADPDSLRVIASGLADWVQTKEAERRRRSDRLESIRRILAATPERDRRALLDGLAVTDPEAAAELSEADSEPATPAPTQPLKKPTPPRAAQPAPPPIAFDELHRLDARALAEAAGQLDGRTALLALAGASDALFARLTNGMTRKAAAELRRRVHRVGPTTLAEIDRAQLALAGAAARVVARRHRTRAAGPTEA
ncbi:FliG C-terminal domain-containing protein [Botrimarina sp.]|uniref:FliG C-terminal domain-containing protein n=1 Tax=Botrimarina sp. TaxID=2795802 RepID=UPI0032EEA42C